MKALILAAGKGTRVRPLTYSIPKPMIPVLGRPVMETLVELLRAHDVRQIMVNTSYLAREIESYFRDGSRWGVEMAYSFEGYLDQGRLVDAPVGSAGAIRRIQDHSGSFDEPFFVLCGDALIDLDLTALADFHRQRDAEATLALAEVARDQVSDYGIVVTAPDGRIEAFQEKPRVEAARSTMANTGVYVFDPRVIDRIPSGTPYDIGGQLFPDLAAKNAGLYGLVQKFQWLDIGKVTDFYRVMQLALDGQVPSLPRPGREIAPGIWVGLNVRLDLDRTHLTPPLVIGGSATIEPGSTLIGPSFLGPGCIVESQAHVEQSVVFDYTRIASHANVVRKLICGDYCVGSDGTVTNLAEADFGWVITDARRLKDSRPDEHQNLLDFLRTLD